MRSESRTVTAGTASVQVRHILGRFAIGVGWISAWVLIVIAANDLGSFATLSSERAESGVLWLLCGGVGLSLLTWLGVLCNRSGRPLVPGWSFVLPVLVSIGLAIVFVLLADEGARSSLAERPPSDTPLSWPLIEMWPKALSFLVTPVVGVVLAVDRLAGGNLIAKVAAVAVAGIPFVVLMLLLTIS